MGAPRGRRPGDSGTRGAILGAARRLFGELGYGGTSLRQVAVDAGVDVRLVSHYFGSKADLFVAAVALPFDPETVFDALLQPGRVGLGARLASFVLEVLGTPAGRETMSGLIRAAASEEQAAVMLRQRLVVQLLLPLARRIGTDHAELRATLMGSQFGGLILARHILGAPALVQVHDETLAELLGPVLEHYLTAPIDPRGAPEEVSGG